MNRKLLLKLAASCALCCSMIVFIPKGVCAAQKSDDYADSSFVFDDTKFFENQQAFFERQMKIMNHEFLNMQKEIKNVSDLLKDAPLTRNGYTFSEYQKGSMTDDQVIEKVKEKIKSDFNVSDIKCKNKVFDNKNTYVLTCNPKADNKNCSVYTVIYIKDNDVKVTSLASSDKSITDLENILTNTLKFK